MAKQKMLSGRNWATLIMFSLLGQIAWCIENSFLNLYLRRTVTSNPIALSTMIAASAIVATITTIIVGWASDRRGKRVSFMNGGYIIWGGTIMLFALFTVKNMQSIFNVGQSVAVILAAAGIVIMDCVMTFFGSTANDACFNAWVTDNTTKGNRGIIEAILSIMAMVAYALIFLIFDGMTKSTYYDAAGNVVTNAAEAVRSEPGNWLAFFLILGGAVTVIGIIGIFLNKDHPYVKPNKSLGFKDLLYGFSPKVIKKHKYYYITLAALCLFMMASNCYSGYLMIYFEYTMGLDNYIIPFGIVYGSAAIAGLVIGVILDKKGKKKSYLFIAIALYVVGAVFMYVFNPDLFGHNKVLMLVGFCLAALVQSSGSQIAQITLQAGLRDLTPKKRVGQFQGVRMVGYVMLPMVIGPMVTAIFITSQGDKFVYGIDEFGEKAYTCSPWMFILAAGIVLLALIPAIALFKQKPQDKLDSNGEELGIDDDLKDEQEYARELYGDDIESVVFDNENSQETTLLDGEVCAQEIGVENNGVERI